MTREQWETRKKKLQEIEKRSKKIQLEMTEEEIKLCIKGIHEIWGQYGLARKNIETLIKLEKSIGINETENYIKDLDDGLLTDEMR